MSPHPRSLAFQVLTGASFAALLTAAPLAAAQGTKLSAPRPSRIVGDVGRALFSADGAWIVYSSDLATDDAFHLCSVPAHGERAPVQLEDLPGPLWTFALAPDSRSVVFQSGVDLFAVAIDGTRGPVRLNDVAISNGWVYELQFTADGERVVYQVYEGGAHVLYVAPLDARSPARRLSDPRSAVGSFRVDPRGERVVYIAGGALWSASLRSDFARPGRDPLRLSGALPAGGAVGSFLFTPDGRQIVFRGDCERDEQFELFRVPIDGRAPPRKLSGTPPRPGRDVFPDYVLSADGARVLYRASHESTTERYLYSAPLDGSRAPVRLGTHTRTAGFRADPTSRSVVYRGSEGSEQPLELFVVPIDGGLEPRRLNGPLPEGRSVNDFAFEPSGERVVFAADTEERTELYSASLWQPSLIRLSRALSGTVLDFAVCPDSRAVVVKALDGEASVLYRLALGPGALEENRHPLALSGLPFQRVQSFALDPAGAQVLFVADLDEMDVFELYRVPLDGSAEPRKLNGSLASAASLGRVAGFEFVPGSDEVVFRVDGCDDECEDEGGPAPDQLFRTTADGSQPPLQLYPAAEPGVGFPAVGSFRVAPDGTRLVYLAGYGGDYSGFELVSVPLDDSQLPVRLSTPLRSYEDYVYSFVFTSDGARVLFAAGGELYSAPIEGGVPPSELVTLGEGRFVSTFAPSPDGAWCVLVAGDAEGSWLYSVSLEAPGGAAPVLLDGPRSPGLLVSFQITADSRRVVYGVGPYPVSTELRSVPIDGSAAPIALGGPLVAGGSIDALLLTPDGSRAVFVADRETDDVHELYSVWVDGRASPVKLSGPLGADADVRPALSIGADGARVVYTADARRDEVFELFSVALDGSASPILLSGSLPDFADVGNVRLSPDGTRAVYTADASSDETLELFSVPTAGGTAPVRLNAPLPAGGDVGFATYQITADGQWVVYLADQRSDEVRELFVVPIDGGSPPERLNPTLVAGGDVVSFALSSDSRRVLYLADQDQDEVWELYESLLYRPQREDGAFRRR